MVGNHLLPGQSTISREKLFVIRGCKIVFLQSLFLVVRTRQPVQIHAIKSVPTTRKREQRIILLKQNLISKTDLTLLTLLRSKCLSSGSCLILSGNLPSKLATIFQPDPFYMENSMTILSSIHFRRHNQFRGN